MDKVWQTINGTRTVLILIGMIVAGALWAQALSNRVDSIDRFGSTYGRAQEERLRRIENNLLLLGSRWDVPMQKPPAATPTPSS